MTHKSHSAARMPLASGEQSSTRPGCCIKHLRTRIRRPAIPESQPNYPGESQRNKQSITIPKPITIWHNPTERRGAGAPDLHGHASPQPRADAHPTPPAHQRPKAQPQPNPPRTRCDVTNLCICTQHEKGGEGYQPSPPPPTPRLNSPRTQTISTPNKVIYYATTFDSTLGFPGEGPAKAKIDQRAVLVAVSRFA